MKKILAVIGLFIGGYIGFLNRPAALLVGQLPFEKVILAGTNLKGVDQVFVSVARTSFNTMLIGAGIGLLAGIVLSAILSRGKRS